jgi:hypothetical protein
MSNDLQARGDIKSAFVVSTDLGKIPLGILHSTSL